MKRMGWDDQMRYSIDQVHIQTGDRMGWDDQMRDIQTID